MHQRYLVFVLIVVLFIALSAGCKQDSTQPQTPSKVATPTLNPTGGSYATAQSVVISCSTADATIYYSVSNPPQYLEYLNPVSVSTNTTLKAKAVKSGWTDSDLASENYVIDADLENVATPTFTPPAGTYTTAQDVTINCATSGAMILYSLNDSPQFVQYVNPLTISANTTLSARAVKSGMADSNVATAYYTIDASGNTVAQPTFNPTGGTYPSGQAVAISCATAGASIHYTTNGTNPTETSNAYSSPIGLPVGSTTTLKAKAFKSGMTPSAIRSETYTIEDESWNFDDWDEFWDYMNTKEWVVIFAIDYIEDSSQYIWVEFEGSPDDVTSADNLTLTINGADIPLEVDDNGYVSTVQEYVIIPTSVSQLQVVFKRNNVTVLTGAPLLPTPPQDLNVPGIINLTQPVPISWTLSQNSSLQACYLVADNDNDWAEYSKFIDPSLRSYTFPAGCAYLDNPTYIWISVAELYLYEYGNSALISGADVFYEEEYRKSAGSKRKSAFDRIRH